MHNNNINKYCYHGDPRSNIHRVDIIAIDERVEARRCWREAVSPLPRLLVRCNSLQVCDWLRTHAHARQCLAATDINVNSSSVLHGKMNKITLCTSSTDISRCSTKQCGPLIQTVWLNNPQREPMTLITTHWPTYHQHDLLTHISSVWPTYPQHGLLTHRLTQRSSLLSVTHWHTYPQHDPLTQRQTA